MSAHLEHTHLIRNTFLVQVSETSNRDLDTAIHIAPHTVAGLGLETTESIQLHRGVFQTAINT